MPISVPSLTTLTGVLNLSVALHLRQQALLAVSCTAANSTSNLFQHPEFTHASEQLPDLKTVDTMHEKEGTGKTEKGEELGRDMGG